MGAWILEMGSSEVGQPSGETVLTFSDPGFVSHVQDTDGEDILELAFVPRLSIALHIAVLP